MVTQKIVDAEYEAAQLRGHRGRDQEPAQESRTPGQVGTPSYLPLPGDVLRPGRVPGETVGHSVGQQLRLKGAGRGQPGEPSPAPDGKV